jgi:cholesterol transport system auxiliary component
MKIGLLVLALAVGLIAGCASGPVANVATYDFGLSPTRRDDIRHLPAPLSVASVAAPPWLNSNEIIYRLNYQDAARARAYSLSQWVAPPAALLTQRLRQQLDFAGTITRPNEGFSSRYLLRTELEEFSQIFDTADSSRALVRIRAALVDVATKTSLAQRTFSVERLVPAPNAAGAVTSLGQATDGAIEALLEWLVIEMNQVTGAQ